ncbi:ATP-binding protein [Streptomyces sp. NPDC003753]
MCSKKVMAAMYVCPPDLLPQQTGTQHTSTPGRTWALAHRPEAVREARRISRHLLAQWKVTDEVADSVLLAVSELVTNAVRHAQPPLIFGLCCDPTAGQVHIEVSDGGPTVPHYGQATERTDDERGRGLKIIELLADAHGDRQEAGHAIHWADITTRG